MVFHWKDDTESLERFADNEGVEYLIIEDRILEKKYTVKAITEEDVLKFCGEAGITPFLEEVVPKTANFLNEGLFKHTIKMGKFNRRLTQAERKTQVDHMRKATQWLPEAVDRLGVEARLNLYLMGHHDLPNGRISEILEGVRLLDEAVDKLGHLWERGGVRRRHRPRSELMMWITDAYVSLLGTKASFQFDGQPYRIFASEVYQHIGEPVTLENIRKWKDYYIIMLNNRDLFLDKTEEYATEHNCDDRVAKNVVEEAHPELHEAVYLPWPGNAPYRDYL